MSTKGARREETYGTFDELTAVVGTSTAVRGRGGSREA